MGDFNGDLGASIGVRGNYKPNSRDLKLLEIADQFNLCPVNLTSKCTGPLVTYVLHCGRYRSTLDYLFLADCLLDDVISANTFERLSKNTYDHVPIPVEYKIPEKPFIISDQPTSAGSMLTQKVNWSRISDQDLKEKYHGPLSVERTTFDPFYHNDIEKSSQSVTNLILHHSINVPLIKGKALTTSDFLTIFELLASLVAWHLMNRNFLDTQQMTQLRQPTIQSVNHIAYYCEIF